MHLNLDGMEWDDSDNVHCAQYHQVKYFFEFLRNQNLRSVTSWYYALVFQGWQSRNNNA